MHTGLGESLLTNLLNTDIVLLFTSDMNTSTCGMDLCVCTLHTLTLSVISHTPMLYTHTVTLCEHTQRSRETSLRSQVHNVIYRFMIIQHTQAFGIDIIVLKCLGTY